MLTHQFFLPDIMKPVSTPINKKQVILFFATSLFLAIAQAQVVECRDSSGKKLFASHCPKGTTQSREVEILSPPTESKEVKENNARIKRRLLERDQEYRSKELKKQEAEALSRDNQRKTDNKCYEDKKKLSGLLIEGPIEIGKERDGTPIYMDDNKRLDAIKELSERLKACGAEAG